MTYRKKLIEVALPLDDINREAAREKSIRHGHPSTLHLWWSRKPLAACRAILFASLVDDPSSPHLSCKFPTEAEQERERERLFDIIREMVEWKNINNEHVLEKVRAEILKSTDGNPPPMLDPFCGGGSIPLEAQRLGLEAHGSDLNPVAVLITKAMIEIPPRFAGQPPVNPDVQNTLGQSGTWKGADGLAEDIRYYGEWMRKEAEKRIGNLYPKVKVPEEQGGGEASVIAWIWARTVKCPNPACGVKMPLVSSFWISKNKGKKAWIEPIVNKADKTVRFEIKRGDGLPLEGTVDRRGARCIVCDKTALLDHVRSEGKAGRIGNQLTAIVAEGSKGQVYLSPSDEHAAITDKVEPDSIPETDLPEKALGFRVQLYGMTQHCDLFTSRQLTALTTFSGLVSEAQKQIETDAIKVGHGKARAYVDAVATFLGLSVSRSASMWSSLCWWQSIGGFVSQVFTRQALSMVWSYAEVCPFSNSTGNWRGAVDWIARVIELLLTHPSAKVEQNNAVSEVKSNENKRLLISTDPPYYDNIGYADLSDFYYIWLRRSLKQVYPKLFNLMLVPKTDELVATSHRFGGDKAKAEEHFLTGLGKAFQLMYTRAHPDYPMTVYYAFKQTEKDKKEGGIASTGWETMLEGLLKADFQITGTWPIRTERTARPRAHGSNALASSVILVCRPRSDDAEMTTRRVFTSVLRRELPNALRHLQRGNIAPVDLTQAAIGPGMAVFSQYSSVLEADGSPMRVRTALQIINAELDAYFTEQEGDLDADTRFCVSWFEQYGMSESSFGDADVLARARDTSVEGIVESGILQAPAGRVRLLSREEYPDEWDPTSDRRINIWECTQYLIKALDQGGEAEAAQLADQLNSEQVENARALAYRLFAICERKGWAQEAIAYNTLITSWTHIQEIRKRSEVREVQQTLDIEEA